MTEPSSPLDPLPDDGAAPGLDRRILFAILAAAVVAAGLLGYFVVLPLFGGGTTSTTSGVVTRHQIVVSSATPTASGSTPATLPKTFAGVVGKNPFVELVTAPVAAASGGTSTTPGGTSPSTSPTGSASPTTAPTSAPTTPGMITFKLISASGSTAHVSVNGRAYTWVVGKVYLGSFKLLRTGAGGQGFFLYGDMPIHISAGQTYIFQK